MAVNLRAAALIGITWLSALSLASPPALAQKAVLAAFRDVVTAASKSTVEVYAEGGKSPVTLGAIVGADGQILTKASELHGKLECKLPDGRRLEAQLVGLDKSSDLALLKIDAQELPTVQWREGDPPATGSWLATPGFDGAKPSPFPIAVGVLSVGPRKIAAPPAAMGVKLEERDDVAMVKEVVADSPAKMAGIQPGDIIRKVNDKVLEGSKDLIATISKHQPGEKVTLVIERDKKEMNVEVVLGSRVQILVHEFGGDGDRADFQNHLGGDLSERKSGFPSAIQHDTILKPAQCGGPIVDLDGKVVGINIARAGRVESYALPVSLIKSVLPDLMSGKLNPNPQPDSVANGTKPVVQEEKKVQ